jgi:hypothetical protein
MLKSKSRRSKTRSSATPTGDIFVGDTKSMSATLTNGTANPINVRMSSLGAGTVFGAGAPFPALPAAVAAAATMNFPLTFTPPSVGPHQGTWHLTLDRRPHAIDLRGEGVLFQVEGGSIGTTGAAASTGLDFGDVVVGQHKPMEIRVGTLGNAAITFPAIPVIAPAGGAFTVRQPRGAETINPLPNPSSATIRIRFEPPAVGRFTATMTWVDATGTHRIKCFLQGNGIAGE